jgi:hypothetical protein
MSASPPNGASRLGLWLSIVISAMVLVSMIGAMFYVAYNGKSNTEALAAQSVLIKDISDKSALIQDRLTKIEVAQNEIETQFCSQDIVRNLMHAGDMRNISLLWEKVFGTRYPTDNAYYPTICNRRVKQQ